MCQMYGPSVRVRCDKCGESCLEDFPHSCKPTPAPLPKKCCSAALIELLREGIDLTSEMYMSSVEEWRAKARAVLGGLPE